MKVLVDILRFLTWGNWGLRVLALSIAIFLWALVQFGIIG
jgi:hypothetical protein